MIEPTDANIGSKVIYTGNRYPGGKPEYGVITSFTTFTVFVRYTDKEKSQATDRADLEWDLGAYAIPRDKATVWRAGATEAELSRVAEIDDGMREAEATRATLAAERLRIANRACQRARYHKALQNTVAAAARRMIEAGIILCERCGQDTTIITRCAHPACPSTEARLAQFRRSVPSETLIK